MNKYIFLFILFLSPFTVSASIDEYKTDVYFANGIMTKEEIARYNALRLLKPAIEMKCSVPSKSYKNILEKHSQFKSAVRNS